jgi:hypothetical protein
MGSLMDYLAKQQAVRTCPSIGVKLSIGVPRVLARCKFSGEYFSDGLWSFQVGLDSKGIINTHLNAHTLH